MKLQMLGGRYQPILLSSDDMFSILDVNPQHWSANCAPVEGLACDENFLSCLDSDSNGKILPHEIRDSIQWIQEALHDHSGFWEEKDYLPLAAFRTENSLGLALKESAEYVLETLGSTADAIALSQVQARTKIQQAGAMNGDGIIPPSAMEHPVQKQFVQDLILILGGVPDKNGEQGINEEQALSFSARAQSWLAWRQEKPDVPFEDPTADIAALRTIQPTIDRFFSSCLFGVSQENLSKDALIAKPNSAGVLKKNDWIHPSFRTPWRRCSFLFAQKEEISWQEWERVCAHIDMFSAWQEREPSGNFSSVDPSRLQQLLQERELWRILQDKITEDRSSAKQLDKLADLEKILLLQNNFRSFVNSYVNFSHFYNPKRQSLPERGSLLMDGRIFRLSVQVLDREQHKRRAKDSGFFLLYVHVDASGGGFEVATAVTGKRRGDLHIGKKGVFTLVEGEEYPAAVVDIVNNPINIQEAFWAPFSSVQGFVQKRLEKFSSQHQQELETTVEKNFIQPSESTDTTTKAALLNGGVTVAALSSSFAYLIKTLSSIQVSQLVSVILAPLLVVAMLSSLMAWWKLQRRDLGPILEASGWGINHPLYAPSWATRVFTQGPVVDSARRSRKKDLLIQYQEKVDPYGRSKKRILILIVCILAAGFWYGFEYLVQLYEWSSLYQPK